MRFILQHHPSRAHLLERFDGFQVVTDPDPDGIRCTWRTYRRCLLELGDAQGAIVQDDVWLASDFFRLAEAQARFCTGAVLCLFVSPQAQKAAHELGRAIGSPVRIPPDHFLPTVAVVWPAGSAREVVAYADARRWARSIADDAVTRNAATHLGLQVWASNPSLVEHVDDTPSLMGTAGGRRRRAVIPHPSLVGLGQAADARIAARKEARRGQSPRSKRRGSLARPA